MTPFEIEVLDSILWQLKGYAEGQVTERATTRILRATLRRIKPRKIAYSLRAASIEKKDIDHAIPLKIIVSKLINNPILTKEQLVILLDNLLVSVELTPEEHRMTLKKFKLSSDMPADWDGVDNLARYRAAGIEVLVI
ncbi:hypothetical protein QWY97_18045 [Vibrio cortegadensis]|uniref:hypothetical protein n=1 Tax=Vibrio cortegadensis TaxID=1328770 RepID=UPI0021C4AB8B|nr:hypothetical protein [Vibrio cortegadensis]MDN3699229.1 hypothetical protein [Vibrio cortegadensis]